MRREMVGRFGIYEGSLVLAVVISVFVAGYAWRHRDRPGAIFIALVLVADAVWAGSSLAGSLVRGTDIALLTARIPYLSMAASGIGLFAFALVYTNRESWHRWETYALLSIEPVVVNIFVWTNPVNLWWAYTANDAARIGWEIAWGPAFFVHVGYMYLVMGVVTVWLLRFAFTAEHIYQRQVFGLLVSALAPYVANVVFFLSLTNVDLTPVAFTITGVALAWVILNARVLDITPIANEAVVDTITDAVLVVNEDGVVADSNQAAKELFDDGGRLVGRPFERALAGNQDFVDTLRAFTEATEQRTGEFELDSGYVTVDASPLRDVRDKRIGTVFVVHDITGRKKRELELRQQNEQLDQFARVVSHDLRNPLQVASGTLELAREQGDPACLDRAEAALNRMEWLVDDLLTLAREGERLADTKPVSVQEAAASSWETVQTDEATLTLDCDAMILADPNRLQQLLENLFRNSVEHAGSDVTVAVSATANGFAVSDDGPGIPPSTQAEIEDTGCVSDPSGTGIGLRVVSTVVEAHNWTLTLTDADGGGARFEIRNVERVD